MWSDRIKNKEIRDDEKINEHLKVLYEKWEKKKLPCPSNADTEALINKILSLIQKVREKYFPKLSKQVIKEKLPEITSEKIIKWKEDLDDVRGNKQQQHHVKKIINGGGGGPKKADRMAEVLANALTAEGDGAENEGDDDAARRWGEQIHMVQDESPEFWAMVIVFLAFKLLAHVVVKCQNEMNIDIVDIDPDWVAFFLALTFALWWARATQPDSGGGKQRKKKTRKHKKRRRRRKRRTKCRGRKKRFRTRRFGNWRCYKRVKRRRRSRRRRRRQRRSQHTRKSR